MSCLHVIPIRFIPILISVVFGMILALTPLGVTHAATRLPPATELNQSRAAADAPSYQPGRLLVKFAPDVDEMQRARMRAELGLETQRIISALQTHVLRVPRGQEMQLLERLQQHPLVEYAEPDYTLYAFGTPAAAQAAPATTPDDPLYAEQWGLSRISAPAAWDVTTGSSDIVIAVVDSGVDLAHPDLSAKLVDGQNFVMPGSAPQDFSGHGTHVASIAASLSNNGTGGAGVAWGAQIMPVKVLDFRGAGALSDVASGIEWAVDNGADVLNLSLGGSNDSATLRNAIDYALANDVFVVAAMGNEYELGNPVNYPAAYPGVFAVAAVDQNEAHAYFSNSGDHVDAAAPGVDILAATWSIQGSGYDSFSGTSMATPFVSGLAALLLSLDPSLLYSELSTLITSSAIDVETAGWDSFTGFGRVDAAAAIALLQSTTGTPIGGSGDPNLTERVYLPLVVQGS